MLSIMDFLCKRWQLADHTASAQGEFSIVVELFQDAQEIVLWNRSMQFKRRFLYGTCVYIITEHFNKQYTQSVTEMGLWKLRTMKTCIVYLGTIIISAAALKHGIRNHGNGNGIRNLWKTVPSDRFEKKYISHDNKINKQIKKKTQMNKLAE